MPGPCMNDSLPPAFMYYELSHGYTECSRHPQLRSPVRDEGRVMVACRANWPERMARKRRLSPIRRVQISQWPPLHSAGRDFPGRQPGDAQRCRRARFSSRSRTPPGHASGGLLARATSSHQGLLCQRAHRPGMAGMVKPLPAFRKLSMARSGRPEGKKEICSEGAERRGRGHLTGEKVS